MAKLAKFLQGVAGAAGGAALNVEDVFSTYLYTGNGTSQTITNDIDLSGEGGAVIFKSRTTLEDWHTYDTERGTSKRIALNQTTAQYSGSATYGLTAFNSDGFSVGTTGAVNGSGIDLASWTFRKAPKFFDVVEFTYTGSTQQINHNLGGKVGAIIMKRTDQAQDWLGWFYRGSAAGSGYYLSLNTTNSNAGARVDTVHSDTYFTPAYVRGSNASGTVNPVSGATYVAYLFAHNNGDGEFGPTGDQDIIKCGSFTTTGDVSVDLGFEPQWLLVKRTDSTEDWKIFDSMRGFVSGAEDRVLLANSSNAENDDNFGQIESTGFQSEEGTGKDYIYIAIRRGPMSVPESATDVFDVSIGSSNGNVITTGFPVDTQILNFTLGDTNNSTVIDRLRGFSSTSTESGKRLVTSSTAAETSVAVSEKWTNTGFTEVSSYGSTYACYWNWRRAPNYFDVVAYTGTGNTMTINHNLGVTPEMIWTKRRDSTGSWLVYHSATGLNKYLILNSTAAVGSAGNYYAVSDTTFGAPFVNSGGNFISYLFASLDGVSKVGSYTGDGNAGRVIDCGFSNGARFVLARSYTHVDNWFVFDSERGIVAGNDPYLRLNTTDAEITNADLIDVHSSGFIVNNANGDLNDTGRSYIFYAVA